MEKSLKYIFVKYTHIFVKNRRIAELVFLRVIKLKVIFFHERLLKMLEFILCEALIFG